MSFIRNNYEPNCTHTSLSPKDYSYVRPVIKEAIIKKNIKSPKWQKMKPKRSDIESKRARKGHPKDIKEVRFRKEAIAKPKHLDIFCISQTLLYMSVHVKTVDKNVRTFLFLSKDFPEMTNLPFPLNCKQSL